MVACDDDDDDDGRTASHAWTVTLCMALLRAWRRSDLV